MEVTGVGAAPPPNTAAANVTITPSSLAFPATEVGVTSAIQVLTVTNNGTISYPWTGISVLKGKSAYGAENNCGAAIAPSASCQVNVALTPPARGVVAGQIAFAFEDGSVLLAALSGSGKQAVLSIIQSAINFSTPATRTVTVTNVGDSPAVNLQAAVSGDASFSVTGCEGDLAVNASCALLVKFAPAEDNFVRLTGSLSLSAGAAPGLVLPLSGKQPPPALSVTPSSMYLGTSNVNVTGNERVVTVTNIGLVPAVLVGISISSGEANFGQSNNCATIAPGASCLVNVAMTPSAKGLFAGMLSVVGPAATYSVALSGTGTQGAASLPSDLGPGVDGGDGFTHFNINMRTALIGAQPNTRDVKLGNLGDGPLAIQSIDVSLNGVDFGQSNNCPSVLAAGASCSIRLTFEPKTVGNLTGQVKVISDSGKFALDLEGNGQAVPAVILSTEALSPFPSLVGGTSATQTVLVTNTGSLNYTLKSYAASAGFAATSTCSPGTVVTPKTTCAISVTYSSAVPSSDVSGVLTLVTEAGETTVALTAAYALETTVTGPLFAGDATGALTLTVPAGHSLAAADSVVLSLGGIPGTTVLTSTGVNWNAATSSLTANFSAIPAAAKAYSFSVKKGSSGLATGSTDVLARNILQVMDSTSTSIASLDFGNVTASTTKVLRLANSSTSRSSISLSGLSLTPAGTPYSILSAAPTAGKTGSTCSTTALTLPAGTACDVTVKLSGAIGSYATGYAFRGTVSNADSVSPSSLSATSLVLPVTGTIGSPKISTAGLASYFPFATNNANQGGGPALSPYGTPSFSSTDSPFSATHTKGALVLNGVSGQRNISTAAATGTGDISFGLWVKTTVTSGVLVQQRTTGGSPSLVGQLKFTLSSGRPCYADGNATAFGATVCSTFGISDGSWHHVGFVRLSTGSIIIYVDGRATTYAYPLREYMSPTGFSIGFDQRDNSAFINASVRDLWVFGRALSAAEFGTAYSSKAPLVY